MKVAVKEKTTEDTKIEIARALISWCGSSKLIVTLEELKKFAANKVYSKLWERAGSTVQSLFNSSARTNKLTVVWLKSLIAQAKK